MSKISIEEQLVPLFGRLNDNRARLLIHELKNQWDKNKITVAKKTVSFQNQFFKSPDGGAADDDIHIEWLTFAKDVNVRIRDKTIPAEVKAAVLNIIHRANGDLLSDGSDKHFTQQLIKVLFENLPGATLGSSSTWLKATDAKYKGDLNGLFTVELVSLGAILKDGTTVAAVHGVPAHTDSGKVDFGFQWDKYIKKMLMHSVSTVKHSVGPSTSFWADSSAPVEDEYFRKGAELYRLNPTTKVEERVDTGSKAFADLKSEDKCLGTGVTNDGTLTCDQYLRDCLGGENVTQCKTYFANANFWGNAVDEVNNMLPAIAIKTLNAFELGMEEVWDNTANRRLLKYKSTESWLKGLYEIADAKKGMNKDEVNAIRDNSKLIGYIQMLVAKINKSPAILNPDYKGHSDVTFTGPDAFAGSAFHKMGVKARIPLSTLSVSNVDKLSQAIKDNNAIIGLTFGLPGVYGPGLKLTMRGGSAIDEVEAKASDVTKHTASIIENHFVALYSRLQRYGKEITPGDRKKIDELILSLRNSESKLYNAILYTEKYAKLLEIHGQKDNSNILSMDHLKQFVENRNKYFTRVAKKQNDLLSIIRSIAEAVNKETPSTEAEMKATDVDAKTVNLLLG